MSDSDSPTFPGEGEEGEAFVPQVGAAAAARAEAIARLQRMRDVRGCCALGRVFLDVQKQRDDPSVIGIGISDLGKEMMSDLFDERIFASGSFNSIVKMTCIQS